MTSTKLTTARWKEIAIWYGRWFAASFTLSALVVGANFFNHQYMDMSVWHWMQFKDMSETGIQSVFRGGEKELWWERRSERRSN